MNKPVNYVIAVIMKSQADKDDFLVVKRPDDDLDLAGHWGFPATTMKPGELPADTAQRICTEKLHCSASLGRFLGVMYQKRNSYDIVLLDMEMMLDQGQAPNVHAATSNQTVYVDQKWSDKPEDLRASANGGSCCSSIFLTDRGLLDKEAWIASLEGSTTVA